MVLVESLVNLNSEKDSVEVVTDRLWSSLKLADFRGIVYFHGVAVEQKAERDLSTLSNLL